MAVPVLYLSPASTLGGAERCFFELAAGLDRARFTPTVVCPAPGPLVDALRAAGVETELVPWPRVLLRAGETTPARVLAAAAAAPALVAPLLARTRAVARSRGAAILHSNGVKMHFLGALLKPLLPGARLVWHVHQFMRAGLASRLLLRLMGDLPDRFITNSRAVAGELGPRLGPRVRPVLNGIDPRRFAPEGPRALGADGPLVGMVGIITPWKGQELFLHAAREVARARPQARFAVVGAAVYDTDDRDGCERRLRRLARDLGLGARLHFAGFHEDVGAVMRSLDVLVHASTRPEPFGRVIVEGMACSRAVVAAASGGVPEIVTDGVDGLLYPMGDAGALARAVIRLLDDEALRARVGRAGRETVLKRFTVDRYVGGIERVYLELNAERGG